LPEGRQYVRVMWHACGKEECNVELA